MAMQLNFNSLTGHQQSFFLTLTYFGTLFSSTILIFNSQMKENGFERSECNAIMHLKRTTRTFSQKGLKESLNWFKVNFSSFVQRFVLFNHQIQVDKVLWLKSRSMRHINLTHGGRTAQVIGWCCYVIKLTWMVIKAVHSGENDASLSFF